MHLETDLQLFKRHRSALIFYISRQTVTFVFLKFDSVRVTALKFSALDFSNTIWSLYKSIAKFCTISREMLTSIISLRTTTKKKERQNPSQARREKNRRSQEMLRSIITLRTTTKKKAKQRNFICSQEKI